MLNGIDPIIIFNFKKIPPSAAGSGAIPILSAIADAVLLPGIPIYLSEQITGIYIDSEDKNIEVQTDTQTLATGADPETHQTAISSTVTINMKATRDSIGVSLLSALGDLVFPKLTSKEYSITYLHGAVTVFGGLLNSLNISQNPNDTLLNITLSLIKPGGISKVPQVGRDPGFINAQSPIIGGRP